MSAPVLAVAAGSSWSSGHMRALLRRPMFLIGAVILLLWCVLAVLGQHVLATDPYETDLLHMSQGPSAGHWLGTDSLGRDVLSRIVVGSRTVLLIPTAAALVAVSLGTVLGLLMGYLGGIVDSALSRLAEAIMALPSVVIALLAITALGPSMLTLIAIVGFSFAWVVARTVRSAVIGLREADFVTAARVRGERMPWILFGEILPNIFPIVIVEFTVRVGLAVFSIASLSFLGFGVQPPSADWGLQIADAYKLLPAGVWWPALFPCLAIASLIVSIYLVAEAIGEEFQR